MAIVRDFDDTGVLSLEAFIEAAQAINPDDERDILTLAPLLRRLANNRTLLHDFIAEGLKDMSAFQDNTAYSAQTYVMCEVTPRSFLRFAIWSPLGYCSELDERRFFSYDIAHDHNFSLLTTGLFGGGYTTSIYQRKQGSRIPQAIGETVELTDPLEVQLSPGRVILYEAQKDIHVQHPPADLSVSLNFIVDQRAKSARQFYYDVVKGKVTAHVESDMVTRGDFFKFASALDDPACNDLLGEIAQGHGCDLTRVSAHLAVAGRGEAASAKESMLRDSSALVRASAGLLDRPMPA